MTEDTAPDLTVGMLRSLPACMLAGVTIKSHTL